MKLLTNILKDVRIREQSRLHDRIANAEDSDAQRLAQSDYQIVKNSQRLLTTSPFNASRPWNCREKQKQKKLRLDRIFALAPDLQKSYESLQDFYEVSHTENFNLRKSALSSWLKEYLDCEIPEVRKAARSISRHRSGIENAWKYQKSNSPTEGLNKKVKDLKRQEFGAHSFERFRKRALLAFGYISFVQEPYTIKAEKGAKR